MADEFGTGGGGGDVITADEFKTCVPLYFELDDKIAEHARRASELRKKKDAIGKMIVKFMKHRNIDECELQDGSGKLMRKESKRTEGMKKEHVEQELMRLLGDTVKVQTSLENIANQRKVETKDVLSRARKTS
jgi:hypothetical protein